MTMDAPALDADLLDDADLLGEMDGTSAAAEGVAELAVPDDRLLPITWQPALSLTPRDYQIEALTAWLGRQGRGVVVLPTGAGKTVVALMAIERLAGRTLIVVPTIELLGQWQRALAERLGLPPEAIGVVGGG